MEKKECLIKRLETIAQSIQKTNVGLALLALGSGGLERDRLDNFSDLDFFVIVEDGYKQHFIRNLDWLARIHKISFSYQNTVDGHKVLFEDGIFCEFAIFEKDELKHIPFSEGRIIWKKDGFDETICLPLNMKENKQDKDWYIGEILTTLYIGLGRYHRGEKLSAFFLIQHRCIEKLIMLFHQTHPISNKLAVDPFNISRRFEKNHPDIGNISKLMLGYDKTIQSAHNIIEYLNKNYSINSFMYKNILELIHFNQEDKEEEYGVNGN